MQFLSTIFAIIGLVAEVVVLWVIAQVFGRVGKPHPSRKSIHDRADEGSDADCYLAVVLKGAASSEIIAGGKAVMAAGSIKHTHSTHPDIARPGDGTGL